MGRLGRGRMRGEGGGEGGWGRGLEWWMVEWMGWEE